MRSIKFSIVIVSFIPILMSACKKKDKDNDPTPSNTNTAKTASFSAQISGDFTDAFSISYVPGDPSIEGITSTYNQNDAALGILTLKPITNGSVSINLYAKPGTLNAGTYNLDVFTHGTSSYYNNVLGAQNFDVTDGSITITTVEAIPANAIFAGHKYFSGTFNMNMTNPSADSISVTGSFNDALVILVN